MTSKKISDNPNTMLRAVVCLLLGKGQKLHMSRVSEPSCFEAAPAPGICFPGAGAGVNNMSKITSNNCKFSLFFTLEKISICVNYEAKLKMEPEAERGQSDGSGSMAKNPGSSSETLHVSL